MDTTTSRTIIYARKSTDSEDRQILSIDSQIDELKQLAQGIGLTIDKIYHESKSAKEPGRPVFNEMLSEMQNGQSATILCWSLDRLARNPVDGGLLIWSLEQEQIFNISTPRQTFHNTTNDKFLMNLEFGMAKKYVDDLSDNVKRGLRAKLKQGWQPGIPPLGYLNDMTKKTIVIDPLRFHTIRKMWELMLSGTASPCRILKYALKNWDLKPRPTKNRSFNGISTGTVYQLFRNPFYHGLIKFGTEYYPGAHTPMVSKNEFDRVQALLEYRSHPRATRYHFLYRGLIRCGECGASVTAEHKVNRYGYKYIYYHCTKRKKNMSCSQHSIEEKQVDLQMTRYLKSMNVSITDYGKNNSFANGGDFNYSMKLRNLFNQLKISIVLFNKNLVFTRQLGELPSDKKIPCFSEKGSIPVSDVDNLLQN